MINGDISLNQGPEKCKISSKMLAKDSLATSGDSCKSECPIKCGSFKPNEYERLQRSFGTRWPCPL